MGRAARLAAVGVLAVSIALALITAASPPAPRAAVPHISGAGASPDADDMLRRCRTVTETDPACARARDEKRRRFFRQEKDEG